MIYYIYKLFLASWLGGDNMTEIYGSATKKERQIHIFSEKSNYKCPVYENKNQKYIYITFSATPYKMAKMIRAVTNNPYSHVSLSFNKDLDQMYSFARYYKQTPFYGGFIIEHPTRFTFNNKHSNVKTCAIPVSDEKYNILKNHIEIMIENSNEYLYNMISAVFSVIHKKIEIDKSYTCIEFVTSVLSLIDNEIDRNKFYEIKDLEKYLEKYVIYEGIYPATGRDESDTFETEQTFFFGIYHSIKLMGVLFSRCIHSNKN